MKRYELSTPRTAFALTAVALTAMTLALSVFVPARINAAPAETIIADAPTRVERIDVVAFRPSKIASTQARNTRRKQQEG